MAWRGSSTSAGAAAVSTGVQEGVSEKVSRRVLMHDLAWVLRRLLPIVLLGFAVFVVLMPISTAALPERSIFNVNHTHEQLMFRFFAEGLGVVIALAVAGFGLCLGLALFGFTLVKQQTTTFFSLGIDRTSLFATRYLAGVIGLLGVVVIPLAISLALNCMALGANPGVFTQFAYVAVGLFVLGLVAMSIAVIACLLTGTPGEALALCVALLGCVGVAAWGLNALMDHLLVGNAYGALTYSQTATVSVTLLTATAPFNPLLFFLDPLREHSVFWRSGLVTDPPAAAWLLPLVWLAVAVVLCAVALWGMRRRRTEKAGIAGTTPPADLFVTTLFGFAAFAVVFHFLAGAGVFLALVAGIVVLALVGFALLRALQRGHTSKTRLAVLAGVQIIVAVVIAAVLAGGGFGYAGRVPPPADVAAVKVSYVGSPNFLATPVAAASMGRSYYFTGTYTYDDPSDIAVVQETQRGLIERGRSDLAVDHDDFSRTVVPYDLVIDYTLKDGSNLIRYYDRAALADLASLLALDDSETVRRLEQVVITGGAAAPGTSGAGDPFPQRQEAALASPARAAFALGQIYLADPWYSNPALVTLSEEKRIELLEAIAEDMAEQTARERYYPSSSALGVIMFSQDGEQDAASFAYGIANTLVYLTEDMSATIRFLQDNELYRYLIFEGEIESLSFQKYDPYAGINKVTQPSSPYFLGYRSDNSDSFWTQEDFGLRYTMGDPEKIAALLPSLRSTYFMGDGGYLVAAKLAGSETYVYRYLPAAEAPENVRRGAF